eukprot:COSAG01_NODE_5158_length_4445_cov_12.910953_6_plen_318_part_00
MQEPPRLDSAAPQPPWPPSALSSPYALSDGPGPSGSGAEPEDVDEDLLSKLGLGDGERNAGEAVSAEQTVSSVGVLGCLCRWLCPTAAQRRRRRASLHVRCAPAVRWVMPLFCAGLIALFITASVQDIASVYLTATIPSGFADLCPPASCLPTPGPFCPCPGPFCTCPLAPPLAPPPGWDGTKGDFKLQQLAQNVSYWDSIQDYWKVNATAATLLNAGLTGVSLKRLLDESPWLQFRSECQRLCPPPRLDNLSFGAGVAAALLLPLHRDLVLPLRQPLRRLALARERPSHRSARHRAAAAHEALVVVPPPRHPDRNS